MAAKITRYWSVAPRLALLVALLGLTLSRHEPLAPSWAWVVLLSVFAFERALPAGRLALVALWTRRVVALGVVLFVVEFSNQQLRMDVPPCFVCGLPSTDLAEKYEAQVAHHE